MKISIKLLLVVSIIFMGFTIYQKRNINPIVNEIESCSVIINPIENVGKILQTDIVIKNHDLFLHDIGFSESSNNYKSVNSLGYLGRYQFGKSTLKTLRYKGSYKDFLSSPNIQEKYMFKNLQFNKKRLHKIIKKYDGTIVNGTTITLSGLLAAAHLSGQGNVKKYFRRGKNSKDAYGTSIESYLHKFSGYELELK